MSYAFWADVVVAVHLAYMAFVVIGELFIVVGWICGWRWVRNPWFRVIHLLAIAYVAAEAFLHVPCPITVWEGDLRDLAGQDSSEESFMGRLVHFVFMDGDDPWPEWVYEYIHIGFGIVVLATIFLVPPHFRRAAPAPAAAAGGTSGELAQPNANEKGAAAAPSPPVPEAAPEAKAS